MLGAFSLCVVLGIMLHSHVVDRLNTTKGLAAAIRKAGKEHAIVVNYGSFDETLPFYLGRRTYLAEFTGELEMGSTYPDAKGVLFGSGLKSCVCSARTGRSLWW